jgi:hypothetical protein
MIDTARREKKVQAAPEEEAVLSAGPSVGPVQ